MTAWRRRLDGTHEVDPWGLDVDLHALVAPIAARVPVDLHGPLPDGPVLVLAAHRVRVAVAVLRATGRPPRVLGIADVEPLASAVRKLGAAVAHPAEAAALLRAGHVVVGRPAAAVRQAAEAVGAPVVEAVRAARGYDLRVSGGWVASAPDAVHLLRARDPDPLRGGGTRRR